MSILELPTEVLEVVIRDLDPLGLVSLYEAHSDVADVIDTTTGIWERACRRYTPAEPLRAVIEQHRNDQFCFPPEKWQLICLKLAKPSLYVSQLLKRKRRLWRLDEEDDPDLSSCSSLRIERVFTFGESTIIDCHGWKGDYDIDDSYQLDETHSYRGKVTFDNMVAPYPDLEEAVSIDFRSKRSERCTKANYAESKLPEWCKKFGGIVSCYYRYGNLLIVGTSSGLLRLYTVEPDIPDPNDILTKDMSGTPACPFATIHPGNFVTYDVLKKPSSSSILNCKTELLYVARTSCRPISCMDVIDREKMFSVVCSDMSEKVHRIDIPSEWDTQSGFLARVLKSTKSIIL